jgi:hypothetical protein
VCTGSRRDTNRRRALLRAVPEYGQAGLVCIIAKAAKKIVFREGDVLPSLASWWYLNRKDIKPVKQILRELLVADHQRQIWMRRGDKANIDRNIPASTP